MNEAQLNVNNNNNNNNNNTSLKQTIVEEEIAPTRSFPIELNNNNFLQRESSMLSSSYKCFGTSPSEVVRNEIALAARDLRGGRKNVGTVATTTMKRCSSSPRQQKNVIAKFSPGSPPSMAFTSDSLEIDDDDYVMVTSPGTGFVPRNPAHTACYQTPPRLGASPLSRGTSPKNPLQLG